MKNVTKLELLAGTLAITHKELKQDELTQDKGRQDYMYTHMS